MGWVYTTTAEIARLERETPTREELARLAAGALTVDGAGMLREALERRKEQSPGP